VGVRGCDTAVQRCYSPGPGVPREAQRLGHDAGILTVDPLDGRLAGSNRSYPLVVILGAN